MSDITYNQKTRKDLRATIVTAWIIAATLDLSAAVIQTLIMGGNPNRMLQFIASGIFGPEAFTTTMPYAALGVLFHYIIALCWTLLFFYIYPRISLLSKNVALTAIMYGLFVWFMMNRVVLPMSKIPSFPFVLSRAAIAAAILIVAIGIPLSYMAKRHFSRAVEV